MIKAIIYDFGGPIITWDELSVYKKHEDHHNLERDAIKRILRDYYVAGGVGAYSSLDDYYKENPAPISITVEELNEVLREANATMQLIPEQIEYIQELKKKYKVGLLSNFTVGLPEILKDVFKIYHLFDVVVSSHDVKMAKPDPAIYRHILQLLDVQPEEAVFTDDKIENVAAAQALGMQGILFAHFIQFKSDLEKILSAYS